MNARDKQGIVKIGNKEYQTVALRVSNFRHEHPDWTLKTSIVFRDEQCVVMLAEILDENGRLIANGHAEEYRTASNINKTSALENSETSAIGRALAALGMGGTEFCSADELVNALTNKPKAPTGQGNGVITPTTGVAEPLSDADKEWLQESANRAKQAYEAHGVEAAIAVLDRFNLADVMDNPDSAVEAEIYRWTLFDSKTRAAIKKAYAKPTADEMISQA